MIQVGFKSDKGIKRRNNEDAFYVMPEENLFIVADGVGGNNAGEIASRMAVNHVADFVRDHKIDEVADENELRSFFMEAIVGANELIYSLAARHPENNGMATTMVICYLRGSKAYIINVGDSRAYRYREGVLSQISEDHTYVNTLIKNGTISKEEARYHEKRNVITRAVGGEESIDPDFFQLPLREGDIFLLCTDGLYGEVDEVEMARILSKDETMSEMCSELVLSANRHGGKDNITAICFKIREGE